MRLPPTTYSPALAADAAALAALRNSRMPCALGADTAPSPSAASTADASLGEHGAIVLRQITTGGQTYGAGTFLPPATVLAWRPQNRAALVASRRIVCLKAPLVAVAAEPGIAELMT